MAATPRILFVDDEPSVVKNLSLLLRNEPWEVLTATSGAEALSLLREKPCDVVVSDVRMPHLNGIEAIARTQAAGSLERGENTPTAVVFLTIHQDQTLVDRALRVGALGYVLKPRAALDLLPAIAAARRGEQFVSPPLHVPVGR